MTTIAMAAAQSAAAAAWATFGVLIVTAIFAWRQVREAVRLRREQSRPFVIIQYEFRSVLIQLAIKNIGQTVARNVRISFDQPLQSKEFGNEKFTKLAVFQDGIPNLAPGQELRIHFDQVPNRVHAGLPMRYIASVRYDDHRGRRLPAEDFVLDLAPYIHAARSPKGLHELVESVEQLRKEISKWTDGSRGLLVSANDRPRLRRREDRPYLLGEALRIRRTEGWMAAARHLLDDWQRRHGWYADG